MTSTIPESAKKPQDHKEPVVAPVLTDDELLADLPALTPPTKLRLRQRNKLMKLALSLRSLVPEGAETIDTDGLADDELGKFLDVLAEVDDFAEAIAENKAEYIGWAEKAGYDHFTALLGRYASAVGESTASSN